MVVQRFLQKIDAGHVLTMATLLVLLAVAWGRTDQRLTVLEAESRIVSDLRLELATVTTEIKGLRRDLERLQAQGHTR